MGWAPSTPSPELWRWSSVRAHLYDRDDGLTTRAPIAERFAPFRAFLDEPTDPAMLERLRAAESIVRPLGDERFLARLERLAGRTLRPPGAAPSRARVIPTRTG
jgi:putative transposase